VALTDNQKETPHRRGCNKKADMETKTEPKKSGGGAGSASGAAATLPMQKVRGLMKCNERCARNPQHIESKGESGERSMLNSLNDSPSA